MNQHVRCVRTVDFNMHLVLCDFGTSGVAYVETDPSEADETTIVRNIINGQYDRPKQVLALNPAEGWCRDVSEDIARRVLQVAEKERSTLTPGTRAFLEDQLGIFLIAAE
jgi:hypothetical protein